MKRILKTFCLLLSTVIFIGIFVSCGRGKYVVAVYGDDQEVYQSEVEDIINYYLNAYWNTGMGESEKIKIKASAVNVYVQYRLIEADLKKDGFRIEKKVLKEKKNADANWNGARAMFLQKFPASAK